MFGLYPGGVQHEPGGASLGKMVSAESFMKTLKQEEINARSYTTLEELEEHVEEFMEQICQPVEIHRL